MRFPDQPPGSVLLGYAFWFRNPVLGITLCGTPRELLGSLESGPSYREVVKHPHTRIESLEVFQAGPLFTIQGGRDAEAVVDLIEAIDRADAERLSKLLRSGPALFPRLGAMAHVPLHHAVGLSLPAIAAILLDRGAPIDARGQFEMTALHWAAARGDRDVVALLQRAGASTDARGWFMLSPSDLAVLNGHRKIAQAITIGRIPLFRRWPRIVLDRALEAAAA